MKKLLVAAMGIAAAYGAFADPFSVGKRFEGLTVGDTVTTNELNEGTGGTYWTDPVSATNTYTVKAMDTYTGTRPAYFGDDTPNNALEVKTAFGQPLKFNFTGNINSTKTVDEAGLYFDSLVKFTVCDGAPEDKDAYNGAKIMMWLQSDDDTVTNIVVKAGYLTYSAGTVSSVATNYTCYTVDGDFADKWHRVTIKAIANITSGDSAVPGFVVFIDEEMVNVPLQADYNIIGSEVFPARNENAVQWETLKALFPSIVQTGDVKNFSAIEFDGTGSINDVTVTDTAPDFAKDLAAPEVTDVYINGDPTNVTTIAEAVALANNASTASISLNKSFTLGDPLVFTGSGTITLDFAGFVLTNELEVAAITNSATALIITNSSNTVGGIYCSGDNDALALVGGTTTIDAGVIGGKINPITSLGINGGYFAQDDMVLHNYLNNDRKKLSADAGMTSLFGKNIYGLVDITYYTVTYDANGGDLQDDASVEVEEGSMVTKPENPTRAGYTFTGWYYNDGTGLVPFRFDDDESEAGPVEVESDLTLTAQWDAVPTYTITFVYGLNGENQVTQIGIQAGATPTLPAEPATPYDVTGYTTVWPEFVAASGNETYTATYTPNTYSVTFYTNSVQYAVVNYTYADPSSYTAPADPSVDGYTFDGWFTDNGTFESAFTFNENVAGNTQVAYAKLTSAGPTPIDPGSATPETVVPADSEANAIAAATITPPAGVDAAAYKENFDFSATSNGDGTYTVTMTGIKDSVTEGAASTAVEEVLSATTGGSGEVTIPAGLYYKITTMTTLDDASPTVIKPSAPSTGKVNVTKPGTDKGFIKIELGTKAFE